MVKDSKATRDQVELGHPAAARIGRRGDDARRQINEDARQAQAAALPRAAKAARGR